MAKIFALLASIFIGSCSSLNSPYKSDKSGLLKNKDDANKHPYVVMISLDGFRHDYIQKYQPPFLSSIEARGIRAKKLYSIFPSKTFPNHYSLVTGLYADNHGIVANRFYDPSRKQSYRLGDNSTTRDGSWYNGTPLWLSVRKQGLLSASYFWVGSDANIQGYYPNYYLPYQQSNSGEQRVQQIIDWLKMPEDTRPHLLHLYFHYVDSAGHQDGPDSNEVKKAIMKVDKLIQSLDQTVSSLSLPVNFVIVSDHGMMTIKPNGTLFLADLYDKDEVFFEGKGPITIGYAKDKSKIEKLEKAFSSVDGLTAYTQETLPKRFHFNSPRTGDIILLADPGHYIEPDKSSGPPAKGGTHGYDPITTEEMGGLFLAYGPDVRPSGEIQAFENIHVYPFVMELLGLKVKTKIDGSRKTLSPYLLKKSP